MKYTQRGIMHNNSSSKMFQTLVSRDLEKSVTINIICHYIVKILSQLTSNYTLYKNYNKVGRPPKCIVLPQNISLKTLLQYTDCFTKITDMPNSINL